MAKHPITDMDLEDGHGALPPDMQARVIHVPFIRQMRGDAAADAMLAKLDRAARKVPRIVEPEEENPT